MLPNSTPASNETDDAAAAQLQAIADSCLYPPLATDIGTEAPDSELNAPFRRQLNDRLLALFEQLRHFDSTPPSSSSSLPLDARVQLTLVYCEQTAKHADFATGDAQLRLDLVELRTRIERDWLRRDAEMHAAVLLWYKKRITSARWRREAGASLGLVRYAEVGGESEVFFSFSKTDQIHN